MTTSERNVVVTACVLATVVGAAECPIEPGSPWENPFVESFNGRARDELLNIEEFATVLEAQVVVEGWRTEYNTYRPQLLPRRSHPAEYAKKWTINQPSLPHQLDHLPGSPHCDSTAGPTGRRRTTEARPNRRSARSKRAPNGVPEPAAGRSGGRHHQAPVEGHGLRAGTHHCPRAGPGHSRSRGERYPAPHRCRSRAVFGVAGVAPAHERVARSRPADPVRLVSHLPGGTGTRGQGLRVRCAPRGGSHRGRPVLLR